MEVVGAQGSGGASLAAAMAESEDSDGGLPRWMALQRRNNRQILLEQSRPDEQDIIEEFLRGIEAPVGALVDGCSVEVVAVEFEQVAEQDEGMQVADPVRSILPGQAPPLRQRGPRSWDTPRGLRVRVRRAAGAPPGG